MRHLKAGKRLGVTTSHRRAMMRNLVTSVIEHEQITCTLTRAKEMRKPLDKMITLGKRGDLHARRQALKFVKTKTAMKSLFGELAERYKEREGGYSRIVRLGKRRLGDGAEMAIIQLIDGPEDVLSELKEKSVSKKSKSVPKETVLEEVSQELSSEKVAEEVSEKVEQDEQVAAREENQTAQKESHVEDAEEPSTQERDDQPTAKSDSAKKEEGV
ncbi:MAG: 50S ribosomal protein L17 [SAR324 cluster bacterium]|nr:50S ribosomal protein L17 [SAR324 cluster bacterium]